MIQCIAAEIWKRCNCVFFYLAQDIEEAEKLLNQSIESKPNGTSCFLEQDCQTAVYLPFQYGTSKVDCQSDCPTECIHYEYDYQVKLQVARSQKANKHE